MAKCSQCSLATIQLSQPGAVPTDEETAKLFGTLIAHSGTYVIERDKKSWTGGDQVRFYKFEGVQRQILRTSTAAGYSHP